MDSQRTVEPLFQTPEQKSSGTVTFRVYLDDAYRNIDGPEDWKRLPRQELFMLIEQQYYSTRASSRQVNSLRTNVGSQA